MSTLLSYLNLLCLHVYLFYMFLCFIKLASSIVLHLLPVIDIIHLIDLLLIRDIEPTPHMATLDKAIRLTPVGTIIPNLTITPYLMAIQTLTFLFIYARHIIYLVSHLITT